MVEAGASEVSEAIMVEALMLAHKEINRLCRWQKELYKALGVEKRAVEPPRSMKKCWATFERNYAERLRAALDTSGRRNVQVMPPSMR
jgi:polyribonucleotide nucleotidyltransferase